MLALGLVETQTSPELFQRQQDCVARGLGGGRRRRRGRGGVAGVRVAGPAAWSRICKLIGISPKSFCC